MCWYSAEQAHHVEQAKAGQRLAIKKVYYGATWVIPESELDVRRPTPVCLLDGTKVLFRFSENMEEQLHLGPEPEATFRMCTESKRDVFEFVNRTQIRLNEMPTGVIFDVLVVPGSEQDSALLIGDSVRQSEDAEEAKEKESFLARLFARL